MSAKPYEALPAAGRWAARPQIMSSRLGGTLVLVCLRSNEIFELNRTGARIWELMTSGAEPGAAVSQLLVEFDVTREVAWAELLQLQQRLLDAELIEIADAP